MDSHVCPIIFARRRRICSQLTADLSTSFPVVRIIWACAFVFSACTGEPSPELESMDVGVVLRADAAVSPEVDAGASVTQDAGFADAEAVDAGLAHDVGRDPRRGQDLHQPLLRLRIPHLGSRMLLHQPRAIPLHRLVILRRHPYSPTRVKVRPYMQKKRKHKPI